MLIFQLLQRSMKLLCIFVLPCFGFECAYKIWWYITGASELPYFYNTYASNIIACILQLCSWLYRISIYILACILYQLICYLHLVKMEDFAQFFQKEAEVVSILQEHLRIRRNLRIISHRYRAFILLSLILVTASQFVSLLTITRSSAHNNIFEAGELAVSLLSQTFNHNIQSQNLLEKFSWWVSLLLSQLCSISLVTGLFICLRSATKITHRAQSITSLAARWHVCATINSYDDLDGETPTAQITAPQVFPVTDDWESDEEVDGDDLDNTKINPIYAQTVSYQKRQALGEWKHIAYNVLSAYFGALEVIIRLLACVAVTYLENNRAGITVFGFMMDRTWLHAIFGIELGLLLWLLNKTIGISHPWVDVFRFMTHLSSIIWTI